MHSLWAIPAVLIIRLIRPIVLIRVGTFLSSRVGHFVADAASQWLINQNTKNMLTVDLYWLDCWTCNAQWTQMVKRNLNVFKFVKYIYIWNNFIPGGGKNINIRGDSNNDSRDSAQLLSNNSDRMMMKFLSSEEEQTKAWLRSKGWEDGQKFVCILVRDDAYLGSEEWHLKYDWSYHDYRNSDISTYVPAMEWLADQGVLVLRMGKDMETKVDSDHANIIDYAFCKDKSDLLDIWLFANCDLCITTMTGLDRVSDIYGKPLLSINYLPLVDAYSWSNSLNFPKHLVWHDSKKSLELGEILNHQHTNAKKYIDCGIEIIDLTEDEITNAVLESWKRIDKTWVEIDMDLEQQKCIWEIVKSSRSDLHGYINPKARISEKFLRKINFYNN